MPEFRPRTWRRWGWVAVALCLVGGVVGAVVAETVSSEATSYRTGVATDASVRSLLDVSGTVDPVKRSTAAFEVSGTVASVAVQVGQQVSAGETLATLEPTSLEKAVTSAEANLGAAEATLTADESAQSSAADPPSTDASGSKTGTTKSSGSSDTSALLAAAQQTVVQAQATADAQAQTAATDLAHARSACSTSTTGSSGTGSSGTGSPSRTGATATDTTGSQGSGGTGAAATAKSTAKSTGTGGHTGGSTLPEPSGSSGAAACTTALTVALDAESQLSTDQKVVTQAENALAKILGESSSSDTGRSGTGKTGTSSNGHAATSPATDSAAQLATDQSTIDSDEAALIEAEQSLTEATLTSPIDGTVAAVNLVAGEDVAAGSTSDVITVIDQESYEATGSLTSDEAQRVKVGDAAIVWVDGDDHELAGVVTRVGPVDVASGNTYPIVVALSADAADLFTGSSARIQVVVEHADSVLSVPTSAVHTNGTGRSYVLTLDHGSETRTTVRVGVVGDVYTQIVSGLHKGESVVLAELTEPVPTSSSTSGPTNGLGTLGGNGAVVHFSRAPGIK